MRVKIMNFSKTGISLIFIDLFNENEESNNKTYETNDWVLVKYRFLNIFVGKVLGISSKAEDENGPKRLPTFLRRLTGTKIKLFEPTKKDEDCLARHDFEKTVEYPENWHWPSICLEVLR